MSDQASLIGLLGALVTAIIGMQWFLLRETRAAVNGLARNISDLTVAIALDIATRPAANAATRELASEIVKRHDVSRARELEERRRSA